jgi:hypothetical protein
MWLKKMKLVCLREYDINKYHSNQIGADEQHQRVEQPPQTDRVILPFSSGLVAFHPLLCQALEDFSCLVERNDEIANKKDLPCRIIKPLWNI